MNKKLHLEGVSVEEGEAIIRQINDALKKISESREIPLREGTMYCVNQLRALEIDKRGKVIRSGEQCKKVNGLSIGFLLVKDKVFLEILHRFIGIAIRKYRLGLPARFTKVYGWYEVDANNGFTIYWYVREYEFFRKLPCLT